MTPVHPELHRVLCEQWCADADIAEDEGGLRISLPLEESDGDAITVWLRRELGGWILRDQGTTLMRLSYAMDVALLNDGQRAKVVDRILREQGVVFEDGELSMPAEEGQLGSKLLQFGQAITRLGDLRLWSWARVSSTFYEDLANELIRIAGPENVKRDYIVPGVPDAESYTIDFAIKTPGLPFYVMGVPHTEKAQLATIVLQYLQKSGHAFESLIVPADIDQIPKGVRNRLLNAANDVVSGLEAVEAIERKVRHRIAA